MKKYRSYRFLIFFLMIHILMAGCKKKIASVSSVELKSNWQFKAVKAVEDAWLSATVPGTIHMDLMAHGKIKDPFYRLNEHDVQWVDKADWEYQTNFQLTGEELEKDHFELRFKGLDTYGKVFLNDVLLAETDNMFRTYSLEVKQHLKAGNNHLRVILESPIRRGIEKYDANNFLIPVSDNDLAKIGKVDGHKKVSIYTRKAGYHFGWDWGPRLVTSGIWKSVDLISWDHYRITDLFVQQIDLGDIAAMSASMTVESQVYLNDAQVEVVVDGQVVSSSRVDLKEGVNKLDIPFQIKDPKLWWPNGMGEQTLYSVEVRLNAGSYLDQHTEKVGLRTIELVTDEDSLGNAFFFKVNGHPVFMKGANYIPQDLFLPRVESSQYESLLSAAKEANMNMLRVWGGGIYENDEFYDLCDELGLLVWQDFMFACAMFPGDQNFLENVRQEAVDNVKRLRNHTSIAMWCGNNEILSAWENWGWKNKVINEQSQEAADTIWKAYDDIFHRILPEVIDKYDATRPYWPSSPGSNDSGGKENYNKGDAHYWMVWWGKQPFDTYNTVLPRFMSEYGFQSFPEFNTVKKYTEPKDYDIYSEVMKSHQRSSIGNETIAEYMLRHYKQPKDFEHFLYVSHILQAQGIQIGIESHRRNRDRCMGSLYWQINDCWPVASWSGIDYYGKWKALHYKVKKSFANFLVSFEEDDEMVDFFIVSDSLESIEGSLEILISDFLGNEIEKYSVPVNVPPNFAGKYYSLHKDELLGDYNPAEVFIHASLSVDGKLKAQNTRYLTPFKQLLLPDPDIEYNVAMKGEQFQLTLKTKSLAKSVFVSLDTKANFSDNYFDMLPGSEKVLTLENVTNMTLEEFKRGLKVISLYDSYEQQETVSFLSN